MIDIGYGSNELNDKYELYKASGNKSALIAEIKPDRRFDACDYIDFRNTEQQRNGVSSISVDTLTIKTSANISYFSKGDRVKNLKDNKIWRINDIGVLDDNDMKEFSMRPRKWTILSLTSKGN